MLRHVQWLVCCRAVSPPLQGESNCPPYVGGRVPESAREQRPTLASLASVTVSLITVSHKTPKSLANAVGKWAKSGLLEMVDEKVRRPA